MENLVVSFGRVVSLVVVPVDDFTGKIIKGSNAKVFIEGEKPPIKKNEGYQAFVNLNKPVVTVHVTGPLYVPQKIDVALNKEEGYRLIKIRMTPNRNYAMPEGTVYITGKALPNSRVFIKSENVQNPYKLLYDYNKAADGVKIKLFNPTDADLDGIHFSIANKTSKKEERFLILSTIDKNERIYMLSEPLKNDYKKIGTDIVSLHTVVSDGEGAFFLMIGDKMTGNCIAACENAKGNYTAKSFTIEDKNTAFIDLTSKED